MLLVPDVCNKPVGLEAEGVKVILPLLTLYPAVKVVPPIVMPVIAPRQVASSVKVTSKAASTVAEGAAVSVGGVEPEAVHYA